MVAQARPLTWRWVAGIGALWILLSIMAEQQGTADLAQAIGWTVALSATAILLPDIRSQIGV